MEKRSNRKIHFLILASLSTLAMLGGVTWFMTPPIITEGETKAPQATTTPQARQGKYVVIYLNSMELELHDGDTILERLPLLSQGKPGSYYETIGGSYISDYKVPLHFSSIGHVYMPHSVHLFGNYFIHGIPYYPNGDPVSSTYSGGCIRLTNENAEKVFDFIERGTPIIVTRDSASGFAGTEVSSSTLSSIDMTTLMVAAISLEFLTQDNVITDTDGTTSTTRRTLLPRLLNGGDMKVAHLYAESLGEDQFVANMNEKAQALGLTNTHFTDVDSPVATTFEDYERFMTYITTYKSYLRTLQNIDNR